MQATAVAPTLSLPASGAGSLTLVTAAAGAARRQWLREQVIAAAGDGAEIHHLDCRLHCGGPWAGLTDYLAELVPQIDAADPALLQQHHYELALALPSLRNRFPLSDASLTDASPVKERVRSYPVDRAYRLLHGLIDLLATWLPRTSRRTVLVLHDFDQAGALMRRFFHDLARRRLQALPLDLVLVAEPQNAGRVAALFDTMAPAAVAVSLPAGDAPPELDALRASAAEWERQLATSLGKDNLIPRLIHAYDQLGEHARAQRWRAAALAVYNHFGLYEDALFFGEPVLTDLDEIDYGERRFSRWHIVSGLFNARAAMGQPEEALRVVRDEALAKVSDPDDLVSIYYTMAMLHCRFLPERDFALAEDYLQRAMDILDQTTLGEAERHYLAVFNLNGIAFIRFQQGRLQDAIALCRDGYDRLQKHLSDSQYRLHRSVLLYNIAQVHAGMRSYDEAITYFTAAMEIDPRYSEYYNDRGSVFLKVGRLAEAVTDFQTAIELSAPYFEVWTNLGQAQRRAGDAAAAVHAYSQALDIEPNASLALVGRAQAYEQLGEARAAIADYSAALARDPRDAQLWSNRAVLHFESGDAAAALEDLDEAVRRAPAMAELYENRAIALAALQRDEEAQRDRDEASRLLAAA